MRSAILLAAGLLAACGGDGYQAVPDANQSTTEALGDTQEPAATIPDRFLGTWDADDAHCARPASEMRLTVSPDRLAFYESAGRVASVTPGEGDAVRVNVVLDGEGMTRERQFVLQRTATGKLSVIADGNTTLRTACPATPGPADSPNRADGNAPLLGIAPGELTLIDPNSGRTRHLTFGMAEKDAVDAIALAAGKPEDRGTNKECGAGPMDYAKFDNGVTAWSEKGKFVGWSLTGPSKLTTMSGVGIGSTRKAVAASLDIKPVDSTLGEEFAAGDLSGLFDGKGDTAKVTALWAGTVCNFR
ncbi:MAG: hypothetical protein CMN72_06255 [Sphingomonas sp.]|nr:hypothetical protein [Sphingomonas sp.]